MDAEPTGRTIDGIPWEEPRPPHLPDALTSVSPWVIVFLGLAALQVVVGWFEWARHGDLRDPSALVEFIVRQRLPDVCAALLGAALFYRHQNAHRRLPMLVVGVVLLNVAALMGLGTDPLNRALVDALPASDDIFGFAFFWSEVYGAAISVAGIFAVLYMARGLAGARHFADVVSGRALGMVLIALIAVASVVSLAPYLALPDAAELLTSVNVINLTIAIVKDLAWAYLFVIAFGGWLAGEQPRSGWLLVALAAIIEVTFLLVTAVGSLVDLSSGAFLLTFLSWLGIGRWVFLLTAFALGLPSAVSDEPDATATTDPTASTTRDSAAG
jgi:hypothetical protein